MGSQKELKAGVPEQVGLATCPVCRRAFEVTALRRVTCSTRCSRRRYVPVPRIGKVCAWCKDAFVGTEARRFCTKGCSDTFYRTKYEESRRRAGGWYVYLWYRAGESLPYYVGSGVLSRKDEPHEGLNDPAVVRVARDSMTQEGARLVESVLIHEYRHMGAHLMNVADPMVRMEEGPLV